MLEHNVHRYFLIMKLREQAQAIGVVSDDMGAPMPRFVHFVSFLLGLDSFFVPKKKKKKRDLL